jgi:hypothetical protein
MLKGSTMWTDTTRAQHARNGPGLLSNLTNAEWQVIEPYLLPPSHVGRRRKWPQSSRSSSSLF